MKKLMLMALSLAFVAGATVASAQTKVTLGTEGAYPPFNWIDENGDLQGFDVDIAMRSAPPPSTARGGPGLGRHHSRIAGQEVDAIRLDVDHRGAQGEGRLHNKYYNTPAKFVRKKGSGIEINKESLSGKAVGVQRATIHENFLRDNYGDVVTIRAYATQDEANLDFLAGRVDLLLADSVVLMEGFVNTEAGQGSEFVGPDFTDPRWFGDGIGIAVRKGMGDLRDTLNAGIDKIRADGTYQKINAKYFDFDVYGD